MTNQKVFVEINENYEPEKIEPAQQQKWENEKRYESAEVNSSQSDENRGIARYILSMFPYPSGKLHMGHVRNYTISDVLSRFYMLKGDDVMQPMGWDAFGLPAENAAIDNGIAPAKWTIANIDNMRSQLKSLGLAIDWSREFATCSPEYYRWEQWFFLQLYKKGMVYKKLATVNWDPVDNTVLANEQVVDGRGWRSGAIVEKREIPMYYFNITKYADELLYSLDELEGHWPAQVIAMQRNWIGRSEGMEVHFPYQLDGQEDALEVFTTRPDTLMGVTYVAVAAEHPLAQYAAQNNPKLADFCQECKKGSVSEAEMAKADKKGMDTGLTVTHPLTGEQVPVWVANYVLMSYGSGAVMAVPAHDIRDHEFATKYNLPIKTVIQTPENYVFKSKKEDEPVPEIFTEYNTLINSGEFDGLDFKGAFDAILQKLEPKGLAKATVQYRLRDWGVSRQRYWGCPIPMINCDHCGSVPVPEEDLPVVLPTDIIPDGRGNPLKNTPEFVNTTCPKCGSPAQRETDTFDTFVESSWYYARFACPHDDTQMIDRSSIEKWLPVSQYVGGIEHAIMHLLYARFFHKLMRDEGLVSGDEPFANLLTQGMVLAGTFYRENENGSTTYYFPDDVEIHYNDKGQAISATLKADSQPVTIGKIEKMSKSKNNGIDPQSIINQYGADTVRLYTLFAAPADQSLEWVDDGLKGAYNFLKKVWRSAHEHLQALKNAGLTIEALKSQSIQHDALSRPAKNLRYKTHDTINKVNDCLGERLALNTPVSFLMELENELLAFSAQQPEDLVVEHESLVHLLTLLSIYAPHVSEFLLEQLGYDVHQLSYPVADEQALKQDTIVMVVQVNGKVRGKMEVAPNTAPDILKAQAKEIETVKKFLTGEIKKEIVVPNKLINIVVVG